MDKKDINVSNLLMYTAEQQASDLHLGVGRYPFIRLNRQLTPLNDYKILDQKDLEAIIRELLSKEQFDKFEEEKEIDFSYSLGEKARFRVNIYYQKGNYAVSMRHLPNNIRTIEQLHLPPILHEFTQSKQGLVLITGPTGEGKSSTLAALIDEINHTRQEHIITIEDPIEYIFTPSRSIIDQREVGRDTKSFYNALRSAFREDANVIMVGEMRDIETMTAAVTAAETGHLIFSTLHTNDASQTIDRIIDSFPSAQQNQIRIQLANSLLGIVSQRLITKFDGGLIPAVEILIANKAVRSLIREKRIHQLYSVIETSSKEGMISLNRSLVDLLNRGLISISEAERYSLNQAELKLLLRR